MQINAVLPFGAVTLYVKLADFLLLFNLCIVIKFTLLSLSIKDRKTRYRSETPSNSRSDLRKNILPAEFKLLTLTNTQQAPKNGE